MDVTALRKTASDQVILDWLQLHQVFGLETFTSAQVAALWFVTAKSACRRLSRHARLGVLIELESLQAVPSSFRLTQEP